MFTPKKSLISVAALFALSACANPPHQTHGVTMNHPSEPPSAENNYNNPVINAEQALKGVLKLLENLRDYNELSLARIKAETGIQLRPYAPPETGFSFGANLTEQWNYAMDLFQAPNSKPSFIFDFFETEAFSEKNPPRTDICHLDLDQFHGALLNMGYEHVSSRRYSSPARQYRRGEIWVDIIYVGESREKVTHDCIKTIRIKR